MVVYIPFTFVSSWILDTKGLRLGVLVSLIFNIIGAALRCLARSPTSFYWAFVGQTIAALAQTFILGVPPKVTSSLINQFFLLSQSDAVAQQKELIDQRILIKISGCCELVWREGTCHCDCNRCTVQSTWDCLWIPIGHLCGS